MLRVFRPERGWCVLFLLTFLVFPDGDLSSGTWVQTDWSGGPWQNDWSDSARFHSLQLVDFWHSGEIKPLSWRLLVNFTPQNGDVGIYNIFAGMDSVIYVPVSSESNGRVYRSSDGGKTWWLTGELLPNIDMVMGITQTSDGTIWVGARTWPVHYGILFKSENAGTSWTVVDTFGTLVSALLSVNDTLFLGAAEVEDGYARIFMSVDGGNTWEMVNMHEPVTHIMSFCRLSDGGIYAGCFSEVLRSYDGGETWEDTGWPGSDGIVETSDRRLILWDHQNLYISADFGETWDTIAEDNLWWSKWKVREIGSDTLYEAGEGLSWGGLPQILRRYGQQIDLDALFFWAWIYAFDLSALEKIGGNYWAGTYNGNAMLYCDDGSDSSAFLWSSTYDAGYPAEWGEVSWDCENCEYIRVKVRTFDPSPRLDWALCDYIENGEDISGTRGVHDGDRKVEYRVEFLSAPRDSLPVFREIRINYGELSVTERRAEEFMGTGIERVYPNPFRDKLRVVYSVRERGYVSVAVYDAAGRRVKVIDEGVKEAGRHEVYWDGRDESGRRVSSGTYFIRLKVGRNVYFSKAIFSGGVTGIGYLKQQGEVPDMKWGVVKSIGALALSAGLLYSASIVYPGASVLGEENGEYLVAFSADYFDSLSGMPLDEFGEIINVSNDPAFGDLFPAVKVDVNGYQHIVYMTDNTWHHPTYEVALKVYTPEGFLLFERRIITPDDGYHSAYPDIALEPSEGDHVDAHVVWMDNRNGNWEIYYRKWRIYYEPGHYPEPLGPEMPVSLVDGKDSGRFVDPDSMQTGPSDGVYFPERPVVAYEPNTQTVHIVWSDKRGSDWSIYYQKQTNDAVPVVLIDDKRISNDLYELHRRRMLGEPGGFGGAASGGGNGVLPSVSPTRSLIPIVRHRRYVSFAPDVFPAADGGCVIAWMKKLVNQDRSAIAYEALDPQGNHRNPWGWGEAWDDFVMDTVFGGPWPDYMNGSPSLASDWGACAWMYKWEGMPWEIGMNFVLLCGNEGWEEPPRVSDYVLDWNYERVLQNNPEGNSMYPDLIFCGGVKMVYQDDRDGDWDVYYQYIAPWPQMGGEIVNLSDDTLPDKYPSIDGNEEYNSRVSAIAWQHWTGYDWEVYERRKTQRDLTVRVVPITRTGEDQELDMFRLYPYDDNAFDGITYVGFASLEPGQYLYHFTLTDEDGDVVYQTGDAVLDLTNGGTMGAGVAGKLDVPVTINPNPARNVASISFNLPEDMWVKASVYDAAGRRLDVLAEGVMSKGLHELRWGRDVAPGVYFLRFETEGRVIARKLVKVR